MTIADPTAAGRRGGWTRAERVQVAGMAGTVGLLTVSGWGTLGTVVAPHHYVLGSAGVFGIGTGAGAYLLGVRHAFDADHVAAIDNVTRRLIARGRGGRAVGFWFSLGHASVVLILCVLLGLGLRGITAQLHGADSGLASALSIIGPVVGAAFLLLAGILNVAALPGLGRAWRSARSGTLDADELERRLNSRGLVARLLRRLLGAMGGERRMFFVGLLFGLGFDTASEVAIFFLASGTAVAQLPWYAILLVPVLFAAGMCLFDTLDGIFMSAAYRWAFTDPVRRIRYNVVVTALSALIALVIGSLLLAGFLAEQLNVHHGPLALAGNVNLEVVGYGIVGIFVVVWPAALSLRLLRGRSARLGATSR